MLAQCFLCGLVLNGCTELDLPPKLALVYFACGLKPEKEVEEYIRTILNWVEKAECNSLHYAMQLGMLTHAVYLAHQELEIEAWDDLVTELKEAYEKKRQVPRENRKSEPEALV